MAELDLGILQKLDATEIPGLTYVPDYITIDEQNKLIDCIDQQEWSIESVESTRRLQQHGYRYDYQNGILVASSYLGSLPDWAAEIGDRLYQDGLTERVLDQATVNEYYPGQGLVGHIDCTTCFGNIIITLTLGSSCVMEFTHYQTKEKAEILLLPGSLLILKKAARHFWLHSVTGRNTDNYQGKEFVRGRRIALTFREALFPYK